MVYRHLSSDNSQGEAYNSDREPIKSQLHWCMCVIKVKRVPVSTTNDYASELNIRLNPGIKVIGNVKSLLPPGC